MPTAQDLVRAEVNERLVPMLRSHGFKGSFPTWRRVGDRGDTAVVNIQFSSWNTSDRAEIYVNLSLVSDPWLDWDAACFDRARPKTVKESDGLWRRRIDPPSSWCHGWEVHDEASARLVVTTVADQLANEGLAALLSLLDRAAMLDCLRSGTLGEMPRASFELYYKMALAVLLADDGPSEELRRLIASIEKRPAEVASWPAQQARLLEWLNKRAGLFTT